jgi:hypothetical protein
MLKKRPPRWDTQSGLGGNKMICFYQDCFVFGGPEPSECGVQLRKSSIFQVGKEKHGYVSGSERDHDFSEVRAGGQVFERLTSFLEGKSLVDD